MSSLASVCSVLSELVIALIQETTLDLLEHPLSPEDEEIAKARWRWRAGRSRGGAGACSALLQWWGDAPGVEGASRRMHATAAGCVCAACCSALACVLHSALLQQAPGSTGHLLRPVLTQPPMTLRCRPQEPLQPPMLEGNYQSQSAGCLLHVSDLRPAVLRCAALHAVLKPALPRAAICSGTLPCAVCV